MRTVGCALLLALGACGAVELPEERFYRLSYPSPPPRVDGGGAVLRVDRLALATHLVGDRLLVAEGPVLVRPYQFHRWAGSLEGMVADALVTGLTRGGAFARVVGPEDPGLADLLLSGRVLEFQQQVEGGRWTARVVLDLVLLDAARGQVVFREELAREVPVGEHRPEAVVAALSAGLGEVVDQVLARARRHGVVGDTPAGPAK